MPVVTVDIHAKQDTVRRPILWRLGKLFNVVVNIRRARVSEEFGHVAVDLEGSKGEVEQAIDYLHALGVCTQGQDGSVAAPPENGVPQPNTIYVRLTTVTQAQTHAAILHRLGKDFNVVVNIERAAFDEEEGGMVEVTLSGPLMEVQRAIAYLHTTGLHVDPRQRSVTDYRNL